MRWKNAELLYLPLPTTSEVPAPRPLREVAELLDGTTDEDVRWALVDEVGRIRTRRRRSGKAYYWLDFRPFGALWSDRGEPLAERRDAEHLLRKVRALVAHGRPIEDAIAHFSTERATPNHVQTRLASWLAKLEDEVTAGDLSPTYVAELRRYVAPGGYFSWWQGRSIFDVDYGTLEDWSRWLAKRPALDRQGKPTERTLSASTRRKALGAFHAFVAWLHRRGDLPAVPPFPPIKPAPYDPPIISAAVQDAILAEIPWDRRGAFLAAACGVRPGEVRAMNVDDYFEDSEARGSVSTRRCRAGTPRRAWALRRRARRAPRRSRSTFGSGSSGGCARFDPGSGCTHRCRSS